VAVIGSGVAGLTAAHVAAKTAHVTLFEADDRLGGHADTHLVPEGHRTLAIDTGFIVHNRHTYPTLLRLFDELGVATQQSEMSLSVHDEATGLEYAGALGLRGLFPGGANLANPRYLRLLTEIPRFHRRARALLAADPGGVDTTLRGFLRAGRFSTYFERHFMEPLVAAVWSCDPAVALEYPARYLFEFLHHHRMLRIFGSPTWRTVVGGSRQYVDRVAADLDDVRVGTKVTSVRDTGHVVEITDGNGAVTSVDAVVIATHPDQALAMLAEPTSAQRKVLSSIPYSPNTALLHTDASLLPQAPGVRASWNFHRARTGNGVTVTYDLTRLQRLDTDTRYLVTLGGDDLVDPGSVIDRMEYAHPLYDPSSVAARHRLPSIHTDRIAFAGAYDGWGFHEDGARSGAAAAERLGFAWSAAQPPRLGTNSKDQRRFSAVWSQTAGPGAGGTVYRTTIRHTRRTPFRRTFTHRSHTWLVDLDHLPDHGLFGRFEARDHLGSPHRTLRQNVVRFLASQGVDVDGGQILMAAQPRAFGFCFNPISVFWCFDRFGEQVAVVVEVHNTYGDRHAYLVHPDEQGRATTGKQMYVSPFHGTDGRYEIAVPPPGERLHVAVTLHTDDDAAFSASLTGVATGRGPLRAAPAALVGALQIRMHGIWLWVRRLPVRPRPPHHQEGVS
jgi:predicted NAD/FAD-binding protein